VDEHSYSKFLIWFCPILNLLCEVSIDLYAPAIVEISKDLHSSISLAQNTMTATIIGFSCGQLLWGAISPKLGFKNSTLLSLVLYGAFTILAIFSMNINMLIFSRYLQGLSAGAFPVISRALLGKNFTGKKLTVAILYLSIAWGMGPIIAPYFGGILTSRWNWQTNFLALLIYAIILFLLAFRIKNDDRSHSHPMKITSIINTYLKIATDKQFVLATMLLAGSMLSNILFGIIGAPMVYHILGQGPDMVGKLSLMIGGGYLLGNLTNRLLINRISAQNLVKIGLKIYAIALIFMGICVFLKLFIPAVATIFLISYACLWIYLSQYFSKMFNYA